MNQDRILSIFIVFSSDAKSGGAAQAAAKAKKLKMRPDEALKILNLERHELNKKILTEVYLVKQLI